MQQLIEALPLVILPLKLVSSGFGLYSKNLKNAIKKNATTKIVFKAQYVSHDKNGSKKCNLNFVAFRTGYDGPCATCELYHL